jgi:hypothetical protein
MAMAAVLAIIGRGGLLFVFREESLVCFFLLAKTLLFFCSQNKQWRIIIKTQNQMAYSHLKAITDAFCGSGIREDKEGWFHSIAGP